MHDLDRTLMEYTPERESFEDEQFEFGEGESFGETGEVFGETELLELASELLETSDEAELNYFLGDLLRKAAGAVKSVISSPVGKALGGMLKGVARKALPMVGSALGGAMSAVPPERRWAASWPHRPGRSSGSRRRV
jgi:hypothetical protein